MPQDPLSICNFKNETPSGAPVTPPPPASKFLTEELSYDLIEHIFEGFIKFQLISEIRKCVCVGGGRGGVSVCLLANHV